MHEENGNLAKSLAVPKYLQRVVCPKLAEKYTPIPIVVGK